MTYVTSSLNCVEFKEDNNIAFYQDFGFFKGLPSGVKFYPQKVDVQPSTEGVWFIADRHGISKGNKYGLAGEYGNGSLFVTRADLSERLFEWCKANVLNP